jgi:hypothetical protein
VPGARKFNQEDQMVRPPVALALAHNGRRFYIDNKVTVVLSLNKAQLAAGLN